jgi:hypothetical protein
MPEFHYLVCHNQIKTAGLCVIFLISSCGVWNMKMLLDTEEVVLTV